MANAQKDATGITTLAPSYEDAVKQTAARNVAANDWPGNPVPDTPRGVPHLNPGLNPAPLRADIPERIPVPVVNDPGLVGANPGLADLNRQYRADLTGMDVDDTQGVNVRDHQAAIVEAAQISQENLTAKIAEQTDKVVSDAKAASKAEKAMPEPKKVEPVKPA